MSIISIVYQTILDALFPVSASEKLVISMSPEEAFNELPKATQTPIERTISIFAYKDERVEKLVWSLKYKKSKAAAKIGAFAVLQTLKHWPIPDSYSTEYILIPMPITKRRRNERGYNQCEILLGQMKEFRSDVKCAVNEKLLKRVQHKSRQTLKNRSERLKSSKGIFSVDKEVMQNLYDPNSIYVVVDDVITTGSTIKEAMETLKNAGLEKVHGISLAH